MKCPNCGAQAADGASECPQCGLVFAKWKVLEERKKRDEAAALTELETAGTREFNPWIGRAIAGALVAVWMLGIGLYYRHHRARVHRRPLGELTGGTVEVRDPATGELRQLPIRRGPGVKRGP
jgi:hypothetical protein